VEIDLEECRKLFYVEAREILEKSNSLILQAEAEPENLDLLNSLFRGIHSIKGTAGSVELFQISEFAHHLESLLSQIRDKKISLSSEIVDLILNSLDYLESLVQMSESNLDYKLDEEKIKSIQAVYDSSSKKKLEVESSQKESKKFLEFLSSEIVLEIKQNLEKGKFVYFIEILYTDQEFQFGYEPFVLLKNLQNNSKYYKAITDLSKLPSWESFEMDTLYLRPKIFCITNLSLEEIFDLALDRKLLYVEDISDYVKDFKFEITNIEPEILREFLISVDDIYTFLEKALFEYEKTYSLDSLNKLFRYIHTIKGDADYIGLRTIVSLTHNLENYLDKLRKGVEQPSKSSVEYIFEVLDKVFTEIRELNLKLNRTTTTNWEFPKSKQNNSTNVPLETQEAYLEQVKQIYEILPSLLDSLEENPTAIKSIIRLVKTIQTISENSGILEGVSLAKATITKLEGATKKEEVKALLLELEAFLHGLVKGPQKLGEILLEQKVISQVDLEEALNKQKPIGEILVESGKVTPEVIQKALQKQRIEHVAKEITTKSIEFSKSTIRIDEKKIDKFYSLASELIIAKNTYDFYLSKLQFIQGSEEIYKSLKENLYVISRLANEMQTGILSLRMIPIQTLFQKYPKVVRDIARREKKEIELIIEENRVEIDKKIADALSEPLIHIVRNACDHGIETPEIRKKQGKKTPGIILLKASYEGNHVVIQIKDDGKGLDKQKILDKASKLGYNTQNLSDREIFNFIFLPGFSTAEQVTEISGRGVGMDVVYSTIKSLDGLVFVESTSGFGTEITLSIPMSIGISKVLVVSCENLKYAIPLENVIQTLKLSPTEIHISQNQMFFSFREEVFLVESLRQKLSHEEKTYFSQVEFLENLQSKQLEVPIVLLKTSQNFKFGLIVDKHEKSTEIAIKPMPQKLKNVEIISGVSIMGDGSILQVLNVDKL